MKRAEKLIRSSLEASINVYVSPMIFSNLKDIDLAEIAITSNANIIEDEDHKDDFSIEEIKGIAVEVKKASGYKCARCWQILNQVKKDGEICLRCEGAINAMGSSTSNS